MKQLAQLVISYCEHFKIDKVVISPGSRNAPLTIGFSNHPKIETLSIVDERCAAFFAMGIAQQSQKPVALVCTSGSALLNYYPAIAEAFYSRIPLIVISADRPKHLIDIGDGQTIRQENVFQNHVLFSANLKAIEDLSGFKTMTDSEQDSISKDIEYNLFSISKAMQIAIEESAPVHINVPFDEPLYATESFDVITNRVKQYFSNKQIILRSDEINYKNFSKIWSSSRRKLILVGVNFPSDELQEVLNEIADDESVLVMTETTSNLHNEKFINSIDKLITKLDDKEFKKLQPEVLLTFGGLVVSKRIKQFLRKYQPKHHWHVDKHQKLDTYFCLSEFVEENPIIFLKELIRPDRYQKPVGSDETEMYQSYWFLEKRDRNQKHQKFLEGTVYSDIKVMESVLETIPNNCQLQISNSSIIRYVQLFNLNPTLKVFCNRGTSGIDGSTSTAIGASSIFKEQTVFVTGDLSFFYDSNALWNSYIPKNFRIIIINNSGGGIFKIIPGPKSTNALQYFETPHNLTAEHLAKMFGFKYESAANLSEVKSSIQEFYSIDEKPKILEIFTPSDINDVILQQYFKNL